MKHIAAKLLKTALIILFAGGVAMTAWQLLQYDRSNERNEKAEQIAFREQADRETVSRETEQTVAEETEALAEIPDQEVPVDQLPHSTEEAIVEPMDDTALALRDLDLEALRDTNADVLGWIHIPDSVISYPLMYSREKDTYLYKAWDGSDSISGSIFLERKNRRDLRDFNTIIYGHHMGDGSMFAELLRYRHADYQESHPCVYIVTEDRVCRYRVFSAYEAPVQSDTYRLYFSDEQHRQQVLTYYIQSAVQPSDIVPTCRDRILTLSTCTGRGTYETRWVVQAVLTAEWEK